MAGETSKENGKKGGRPKGSFANHTITAIQAKARMVERYLREQDEIDEALFKKAKTGDVGALKELYDRVFGKSKDSLDLLVKENPEITGKRLELYQEWHDFRNRAKGTGDSV